jgi:beta-galactosidase
VKVILKILLILSRKCPLVCPFTMIGLLGAACRAIGDEQFAVVLPTGVKAVWDIGKAEHESTASRERICLNGLWRWQPAEADANRPPAGNWGYFKVPGCWPGITDYEQKDCQTLFAHPSWKNRALGHVTSAWYQREIAIPKDWTGRRIELSLEYLNSYAAVYVDGKKAGEARFPEGTVDLSSACRPGEKHLLSLHVIAMPLKGVLLSYQDTNSARQVLGTVNRRGLCGDVYLVSTSTGPRITDTNIETSVRRSQITISAALSGLKSDGEYFLRARIWKVGQTDHEFNSRVFKASDLEDGRLTFRGVWLDKIWDINTPENTYEVTVSLAQAGNTLLDAADPVRFGFREFWIDGRDFYLNGTRIYLSAVPLDNAQIGAAWATYSAARESLERLKSFGVNFVYTHNYGCEPGSHLSFAEILRAADDVGMLVALSQPHFSHYEWKQADADANNSYARHAEFYVRVAGSHPAVVAYAMSHNATGYDEDMNPDLIDGLHDPRDQWSQNNARTALRAEAIVKRLDPVRIVYHHASGNLGVMHDSNFYPNFAPIQELCDWFEHWATKGVKPMFTCEFGAPFSWDWGMYRGWYKGQREWGGAKVPWDFCLAEWNAQFLGDRAYQISDRERANLRWEAKQFRTSDGWHRWDYPNSFSSRDLDERYPVFAMYLTDMWRAFRTWSVSAISPWEHELFWKPREGVKRGRQELPVDWHSLQRPGFSPDFLADRSERFDLAFDRSDWKPTPAAEALIRNNLSLLAYIAGKPARFTSKDHNFRPGDTIEKQIIVINNSRRTVTCNCEWSFRIPEPIDGRKSVSVRTGQQERIPLKFKLPDTLPPGGYELTAKVAFVDGPTQEDRFHIDVLPHSSTGTRETKSKSKIALFDPNRETAELLRRMGTEVSSVSAGDDLSMFDALIVGKGALTVEGAAPRITRVREGLRVLMFEQSSEVLERRFGFRVQEYGLRTVFPRVPDHPLLAGLGLNELHDWRGEATLLLPRLKYELRPRYGPTVTWCGLTVPRVWRCGNQGNVASVLIEKPARGDFLPIVDGGYSLQYSPLLEYREGRGMILFCQLDVTGRSETEPAAETIVRDMLQYLSAWKPAPPRKAVYSGNSVGLRFLGSLGVAATRYEGGKLQTDQILIVGPGARQKLAESATDIADWLKAGGTVLAIGLDQQDADGWLPFHFDLRSGEHVAAYFQAPSAGSPFAGIGPADVHNRDPRELPLVAAGATIIGDGVLAKAEKANVVFCQLAPWQFEGDRLNLKQTRRRTSFLTSRLLANSGIAGSAPIVERFQSPVAPGAAEHRWTDGLYLDQPEEWDDPYRFFRW